MIHNHPTWVIKSMIYRLGILSISLLTVGCVSTSNVLELGRDTYTVSATADGFRDAASARQSAFKTGSEKCNSLGKKFLLTNENVANTRMGIDTTVTLYFRCLDERDSNRDFAHKPVGNTLQHCGYRILNRAIFTITSL